MKSAHRQIKRSMSQRRKSASSDDRRVLTAAKVIVAANPKSGATSGLEQAKRVCETIEKQGLMPELMTDPAEIKESISTRQEDGSLRYVVAAGGDGTAAMVASWLRPNVPMAIFPLGTENLLAKKFGIRPKHDQFEQIVKSERSVSCDAGEANGRLFLLHATVGFDAEVVRLLHENRTGHIRHWYYISPLLKSIRHYQYPEIEIKTDRDRRPLKARWAFVFNFPAYAMGLPIVSDAVGDDGVLDLLTFRGGNLLNGLLYFFGVVFRRHRSWRDTHVERSKTLSLSSSDKVPFQLDGDPGGFLPLEIKVLPNRFQLMVPP